jgi:hypothetical protein
MPYRKRIFSLFFRYAVIIMEYVGSRNLHRLLIETPDKFLGTYPLIIRLSKVKDVSFLMFVQNWLGWYMALSGGHRHLQIGRMLDIDLISEPPPPPTPICMYPKCGICVARRGWKRFIASWDLRMSHICHCTPCPSPPG